MTLAGATAGTTAAPADGMDELLTDEEFVRLCMTHLQGHGSDKPQGRPNNWNGVADGWISFAYEFQNWLSGMPGDVNALLNEASKAEQPLVYATFNGRRKVMASEIMRSLKALVDDKALDIINTLNEKLNGFEAWRLLNREYEPKLADSRLVSIEDVMSSQPKSGQDFSDWWYGFLKLIDDCESTREKALDDDVKCAVVLKKAPQAMRNHLVQSANEVGSSFPRMRTAIEQLMGVDTLFQRQGSAALYWL